MLRRFPLAVLCSLMIACGGGNDSPTAPTPVAPAPTPTPPAIQRYTLVGVVRNAATGRGAGGLTVTVTSTTTSTNGSAITNGDGYYSIDGVGVGGPTTIRVTGDRYNTVTQSNVTLARDERRDIDINPFFARTGTGANVFDLPTYVSRVRIRGTYTGSCENFIVRVAGRLIVNEILGTCSVASGRNYDGTHLVTDGGVTEIRSSSGIQWEFTQEQ